MTNNNSKKSKKKHGDQSPKCFVKLNSSTSKDPSEFVCSICGRPIQDGEEFLVGYGDPFTLICQNCASSPSLSYSHGQFFPCVKVSDLDISALQPQDFSKKNSSKLRKTNKNTL